MTWLEDHQALFAAAGTLALAIVAAALAVAVWRALRQGRRALIGADPVMQTPALVPSEDGGLVLHVRLRNVAPHPAMGLAVSARVEGEEIAGRLDDPTLWGTGTADVPRTGGARFTWPVGVLDGDLEVRWSWTDGAGRHRGRWTGLVRVPHPPLPEDDATPPEPPAGGVAPPDAHPTR